METQCADKPTTVRFYRDKLSALRLLNCPNSGLTTSMKPPSTLTRKSEPSTFPVVESHLQLRR
jgi:hypothetical protein